MPKLAGTTTRHARGVVLQRGSALIVALVFLLAMTLIGVTAMQGTNQEERMAGNARDRNLAFQASESAIREGEEWLRPRNTLPTSNAFPCSTGQQQQCVLQRVGMPDLVSQEQNASWWTSNAREYGTVSTKDISSVATDPYYVIVERAFLRDELGIGFKEAPTGRDIYDVTARGTGATDDAKVMLQTTYAKRFN